MRKWHLYKVKSRHWLRFWKRIVVEDSLAPLTDSNARLNFFAILILLFLILPERGFAPWKAQVMSTVEAITVVLYAFPLFVLLNSFLAIFKTNKTLKELGKWADHRFVYHSPQQVFTVLASDKDNDKTHVFKIEDAEIGALLEMVVNIDSPLDRVKAQVVWPKGQNLIDWIGWHGEIRQSLKLPEDRLLALRTYAPPETFPVAIRVYVASWEISKHLASWDVVR